MRAKATYSIQSKEMGPKSDSVSEEDGLDSSLSSPRALSPSQELPPIHEGQNGIGSENGAKETVHVVVNGAETANGQD